MAQKTVTRTAVVVSAAQRKTALSVVRGVQLAIHSAAGLVKDVDVESLRLLRVCEGLVRAAAGRLEALGRSTLVEAEKEAAKSVKADDKANTQPFQDKGKGKNKGKTNKNNNRKDADMNEGNADLPTAVAATGVLRSLSSAAATFVPMQTGLDDEWADSLPQVSVLLLHQLDTLLRCRKARAALGLRGRGCSLLDVQALARREAGTSSPSPVPVPKARVPSWLATSRRLLASSLDQNWQERALFLSSLIQLRVAGFVGLKPRRRCASSRKGCRAWVRVFRSSHSGSSMLLRTRYEAPNPSV